MKGFPDARPERWLGALALIVISLISLGNVITRYLTGGSFSFTEEFSVFLLVVLTFAGASVALRRDRHIRIGFLERALPERWRGALILFQALCGLIVLGLITWYGGKLACPSGGTWCGCLFCLLPCYGAWCSKPVTV